VGHTDSEESIMSRRPFVERTLLPLMLRNPRLGLTLADLLYRAEYRIFPGRVRKTITSRCDWQKLLGAQSRERLAAIRLQQHRNFRRKALLERYLKRAEPVQAAKLIRWEHLERIEQPLEEGRPVILALWHVGPLFAAALGLMRLNRPISFILNREVSGVLPDGWELITTEQGKSAGIQAFRKGIGRLREGRPLAIACDVFCRDGDRVPARVFDLDLEYRRGFTAFARATGAMVIPIAIRWEGASTVVYEALPPLKSTGGDRSDREAFELAVAAEYAKVLDDYMRAHPYDIDPGRAGQFVNAWKRIHGRQDWDEDRGE